MTEWRQSVAVWRLSQRIGRKAGKGGDERFFAKYGTHAIGEILASLQLRDRWPKDLMFDGPHCFRHSMAMDVHNAVMEHVRASGGWKGKASAARYASGVPGAIAAQKSAKRQENEAKRSRARGARTRSSP